MSYFWQQQIREGLKSERDGRGRETTFSPMISEGKSALAAKELRARERSDDLIL